MTSPVDPVRVAMSFVDEARKAHGLSYRWLQTDAGRALSKRPKQTNDCAVRAVALALDITYDQAFDLLKAAGRSNNRGFQTGNWLNQQPWAQRESFPAQKGQRRMNIAQFCADHPGGTYIIKVAKHVLMVRNGCVYDSFENPPDRCVYSAWLISQSAPQERMNHGL